jgi:hypothetical protein
LLRTCDFAHKTRSPDKEAREALLVAGLAGWVDKKEGSEYEDGILAGGRNGSGAGAARVRG